jgi:hypothetical protein
MRNLPVDIKAEVLLDYLPEGSFELSLRGLHHRNACKDIVEMDAYNGDRQILGLARKSLYDSLPEYIFHPSDRFDGLTGREMRDRFSVEFDRQEKEKEDALAFFAPIDLAILSFRREVYRKMLPYVSENKVLQDLLGDRLTEGQRKNRLIRKAIPFLQEAKWIRGNRTLLTLLLRKLFKEERLDLEPIEEERYFNDAAPRYEYCVDDILGEVFTGNEYPAPILCYRVRFWSDEECDGQFLSFIDDVEEFRHFIKEWFLSVEEDLVFRIEDDQSSTWLSDTLMHSYLNYNTNL